MVVVYIGGKMGSGMEKGIRFKLIWEDSDMVEIELSAWNGEFGGVAKIYLGHGELVATAMSLEGFPLTSKDERIIELGDLNPDGLGGAILRFYIKDLAGHAGVAVSIQAGAYRTGHVQNVTFHAPIEAAAMDHFVSELRVMEERIGTTALLKTSS